MMHMVRKTGTLLVPALTREISEMTILVMFTVREEKEMDKSFGFHTYTIHSSTYLCSQMMKEWAGGS